jgi:protein SCO1/2
MNARLIDRRRALLCLGALAWAPRSMAAWPSDLPGDSVYQLPAGLVNQDGQAIELSSMRGHAVLVSMFYSSCEMVCPMIFETMGQTLKALPAAEGKAVKVLLVSFDPARDTVPVLKKTAQAHGCDERWTLARGDDATVRAIAATLGIQYRRLSSGEFNHSTTIDVLDGDGRIVARSGKLGAVDAALTNTLHRLASGARTS